MQRVWSRLVGQRREEQTKQRLAEEIGRLEQRREVQRKQRVAAQSRAERARGAEKSRVRSRVKQTKADQEVRVAELQRWIFDN